MKTKYDIELLALREELDIIDDQLVVLLLKRFNITEKVGLLKSNHNKEIVDSSREVAILSNIRDKIIGKVGTDDYSDAQYILDIYIEIMNQSKKQQANV